jgi:intracellular multiplication protein IcmV
MKIRPVGVIKSTAKSFVDVSSWFGMKTLKDGTKGIVDSAKPLFAKPEKHASETFEEAMARFQLTDADLVQKSAFLLKQAWIYLGAMAILLTYSLFLIIIGKASLSLIVWGIMVLLACKAYRAHFHYYEIQQRRLGCTFREWYQSLFKRKK